MNTTIIAIKNIESVSNYRNADKNIDELANSIRQIGLLQPVTVRPKKGTKNKYELISGHRRLAAYTLLQENAIPAVIVDASNDDMLIYQITENMNREDAHPLEHASAIQHLLSVNMTIADIAKKLGKTPSTIQRLHLLNNLIPEMKEWYSQNDNVSIANMCKIALCDPEIQLSLVDDPYRIFRLMSGDADLGNMLHRATWDLDDKELLPSAGSCTDCSYNSRNKASLFPENDHICYNNTCYHLKQLAWAQQLIDRIEEGDNIAIVNSSYHPLAQLLVDKGIPMYQFYSYVEMPTPPDVSDYNMDDPEEAEYYNEELRSYQMELDNYEEIMDHPDCVRCYNLSNGMVGIAIASDLRRVTADKQDEEPTLESKIAAIEKRHARALEIMDEKFYKEVKTTMEDSQYLHVQDRELIDKEMLWICRSLLNNYAIRYLINSDDRDYDQLVASMPQMTTAQLQLLMYRLLRIEFFYKLPAVATAQQSPLASLFLDVSKEYLGSTYDTILADTEYHKEQKTLRMEERVDKLRQPATPKVSRARVTIDTSYSDPEPVDTF